jgi:hypothetical protein
VFNILFDILSDTVSEHETVGREGGRVNLKTLFRLQWDRAAAWAFVGIGAVVLVVGWVGVSGSALPAEQLPYIISAGIGGMFLLGLGAMLWLSADLRDEWRKLDRIERRLGSSHDTASVVAATSTDARCLVPVGEGS